MTDKQIIINGVDVSGCVRLQDDNISCELGGKCQSWDNCYYKQLKRAKQKLEKIKQYLCENVCLEGENCKFCDNHDCINIEILQIIEE